MAVNILPLSLPHPMNTKLAKTSSIITNPNQPEPNLHPLLSDGIYMSQLFI